jgi:hypothetical protein
LSLAIQCFVLVRGFWLAGLLTAYLHFFFFFM